MGHNKAGNNRKKRLKRNKKQNEPKKATTPPSCICPEFIHGDPDGSDLPALVLIRFHDLQGPIKDMLAHLQEHYNACRRQGIDHETYVAHNDLNANVAEQLKNGWEMRKRLWELEEERHRRAEIAFTQREEDDDLLERYYA